MLFPFVSIGLLSAWSVFGSQREYRIECSFLHLLSLIVLSISLTFVALLRGLNTTHHSVGLQFNNRHLHFSTSADTRTKCIGPEVLDSSSIPCFSEALRSKSGTFVPDTSLIFMSRRPNTQISQFWSMQFSFVQLNSIHSSSILFSSF